MRDIYFDNSATTRVDEDIAAVALEMMTEEYGNPSSLYGRGFAAEKRVEAARCQVAAALGCKGEEVIFTGSGTEANNLAILGGAGALCRRGKTLVAMSFEHASVLEPLRHLEREGWTLRLVNPNPDGTVDGDRLLAAVDGDTVLVSCMLVNSEVGTIAPVADIVRKLRLKNKVALFHCDAVQAFGKLPFSAAKLGVDLLTVSAHKLYAPKGCGALYVRSGVRVLPLLYGGGQERGLRPGTESAPLICAFGYAAEKAARGLRENLERARDNFEYFVNKAGKMDGICINSPPDGTPYLCNLSVPGYRSEVLLHYLSARGISVSSGSACSKGAKSHVLTVMGLDDRRVDSALRVSFSRYTTREEIDIFFETLAQGMNQVARG